MRVYFLLAILLFAMPASGQGTAKPSSYDTPPQFYGGNPAIQKYLTANLVYPEQARKKNIEGKVLVGFIVNEKGKVVSVNVLKPVNKLLDAEALRVIKAMPPWKPALKDGLAIAAPVALPIIFKLRTPAGAEGANTR